MQQKKVATKRIKTRAKNVNKIGKKASQRHKKGQKNFTNKLQRGGKTNKKSTKRVPTKSDKKSKKGQNGR